jgi:hypothetical protein
LELTGGEIITDLEFRLLTDSDGIYGVGFRPFADQHNEDYLNPAEDIILRADLATPTPGGMYPAFAFDTFDGVTEADHSEDYISAEENFVHIQAALIAQRNDVLTPHLNFNLDEIDPEECRRFSSEHDLYQREAFEKVAKVLRTAHASCVTPSLLPLLRQLSLNWRYRTYTYAAASPRFAQLLTVFPVLGIKLMCTSGSSDLTDETIAEGRAMVEEGCKLRKIADVMEVAYAMRRIGIQDAPASPTPMMSMYCDYNSHLRDYWDRNSENISEWLGAHYLGSSEYAAWVASNYHKLSDDYLAEQALRNIGDWVRAGLEETGIYPVTRPFVRTMSPRTVKLLSEEWHRNTEHIYNGILGISRPESWHTNPEAKDFETEKEYTESIRKQIAAKTLPKAWLGDAEINGIAIKAASNELELIEASLYLKNCGGTYSDRIHKGECCIYTATHGSEFLAMIEVQKHHRGFHVTQCAGYLNQVPSKEVLDTVDDWKRSFPIRPEPTWEEIYTSDNW